MVVREVDERDAVELRDLADRMVTHAGVDVALLGTRSEGRALLAAAVSASAQAAGVKAGALVSAVAPAVGGGGGGRPDRAGAGGKRPEGLPAALEEAKTWLLDPARQGLPSSRAK